MDDVTAGKGRFALAITDATNPDLSRFLKRKNGKLLLYHGWADPEVGGQPTLDYYKQVVQATFAGDVNAARDKVLVLFMVPGMGHCFRRAGVQRVRSSAASQLGREGHCS